MAKRKQPWPYDIRLKELLVAFLKAAKRTGKPYAIGGSLAMSAHGYTRNTTDIDAFLLEADRLDWIRALRAQGLTIDSIFRGHHYIAFYPHHGDPRIRIDLLFPAGEPELSAVEYPDTSKIGAFTVAVFPLDLLVVAKFLSDVPEHQRDFDTMFNLGLVDPQRVKRILTSIEPASIVRVFNKRVTQLSRPKIK
jgi:hypothetical protein